MNKQLIVLSALLCSGVSSIAQAVSTGTITFNGLITDTTCDVSVNGQGADATVTLPTVSSDQLVSIGNTTGRTNFNMELTNCTLSTTSGDVVTQVSAFFQAGATVDPVTGHLKQTTSSGAQNVSLQLLDGTSYQPIIAGDFSQTSDSTFYNLTDDGTATGNVLASINLPYAVEYYADGQSTPGVVTSSVVYNLMYK